MSTENKSFNDWPNTAGFETFHDEQTPIELTVTGKIPPYATGVLYRTGPGGFDIQKGEDGIYSISHWFDGFGQVHRFEIVSPAKVLYNSRHVCDNLVNHIRTTGQVPDEFSFGQKRDPCQSYFSKFISIFQHRKGVALDENNPSSLNVSVTVSPDFPGLEPTAKDGSGRSLYTKTDANIFQGLDPETLEPVGVAKQNILHPELTGPLSAAHARSDPITGDVFNYNLDIGMKSTYRVFKVSKSTGETTILARITEAPAAYIHSFFITKSYIILCIYSIHYGLGGAKMVLTKNLVDAMDDFDNSRSKKAIWYVVDRLGDRGVVKKYTSDAFFAFHTINAWETETGDILADVTIYESLDIIKKFYLENLKGNAAGAAEWAPKGRAHLMRYKLPSVASKGHGKVEIVWKQHEDISPELTTLNPRFITRPNRYIYGILNRVKSSMFDGLIKFDSETGEHKFWEKHAHTPGEAIFIPNPDGIKEDDGVLLTVILDGVSETSYLLCLDTRTMEECGRAEMKHAVGFGFHGTHIPVKGKWGGEV